MEGTNDGNIAGDDAFGGAGGQINREIGAVAWKRIGFDDITV